MASNKNGQPYFVVRASAFPEGQADGPFVRTCDRKGQLTQDGTYRIVRFGARVGALVAESPAKDREALVVSCVLSARKLAAGGVKVPAGLVNMLAYETRGGVPEDSKAMREMIDHVAEVRARLRNPSKRKETARAILSGE